LNRPVTWGRDRRTSTAARIEISRCPIFSLILAGLSLGGGQMLQSIATPEHGVNPTKRKLEKAI